MSKEPPRPQGKKPCILCMRENMELCFINVTVSQAARADIGGQNEWGGDVVTADESTGVMWWRFHGPPPTLTL